MPSAGSSADTEARAKPQEVDDVHAGALEAQGWPGVRALGLLQGWRPRTATNGFGGMVR